MSGKMECKTPTKDDKQAFLPIYTTQSPAKDSPQKNLTGYPRVVKDIAADVFNTIQKWNGAHLKGIDIVNQVSSIFETSTKYSEEVDKLLANLYQLVQELRTHCEVLHSCAAKLDKVLALNKSNSIQYSCKTVKNIAEAYKKELEVKEYVLTNIGYSKTKYKATYFATIWMYQKHIDDDIDTNLAGLLVQTGHRIII